MSQLKTTSKPWQGLVVEDPATPLEECLDKMVAAFPKLTLLANVRDTILGHREYEASRDTSKDPDDSDEPSQYFEECLITSKDVFTLRCYCGLCYFLLEYNLVPDDPKDDAVPDEVYGFTFTNRATGQTMTVQSFNTYDDDEWGRLNDMIFEITD